jgi:S-adenosylmethionine synthetase
MIINQKVYTVESVTSGHPDKVCDQISDAILDACLAQDKNSRVAVESLGGHGLVVIGGEVTTLAKVNYEEVAKKVYKDVGYSQELKFIINITMLSLKSTSDRLHLIYMLKMFHKQTFLRK